MSAQIIIFPNKRRATAPAAFAIELGTRWKDISDIELARVFNKVQDTYQAYLDADDEGSPVPYEQMDLARRNVRNFFSQCLAQGVSGATVIRAMRRSGRLLKGFCMDAFATWEDYQAAVAVADATDGDVNVAGMERTKART